MILLGCKKWCIYMFDLPLITFWYANITLFFSWNIFRLASTCWCLCFSKAFTDMSTVWTLPIDPHKTDFSMIFLCSISLPYDHTYQNVYKFGIYTRLRSKVLPLSVTWYSLPGGVTSLWVSTAKNSKTFSVSLCNLH